MIVLNGEEGLECKVHVDGIRLEHFSEFKYLGCDLVQMGQNAVGRWQEGEELEVPSRP